MLGEGVPRADALARLGHVAEGVRSAPAVLARASSLGVQMPITTAVCAVLDESVSARQALEQLLSRDPKRESLN
jgi:glycerol-3-phosphate dehydrogenase (NAD(P)+)